MAKFIFTTLVSHTGTHTGPSGFNYVIFQGKTFEVTNKEDIEYFKKNPRFKQVGILHKDKPAKDTVELLSEELNKIKGLSKKSKEFLVTRFKSIRDLTDQLETVGNLGPELNKKQHELLNSYLFKNKEDD